MVSAWKPMNGSNRQPMTSQTASENYATLLRRLQRLERDNLRMKRAGALILVAMAALIFMGQAGKNRALDADSLVIRDANGKEVIVLGTGSENLPFLRMMGGAENKAMNVLIASDANGGAVTFLGKGASLVSLGSNLS